MIFRGPIGNTEDSHHAVVVTDSFNLSHLGRRLRKRLRAST
jgi:hypothetical protein